MEVDLLKQIVKNTEHKTPFQIIVSDSKSRFKSRFNPTLQLDRDKEYEIALVNLETYYSFPNIDETNNMFVYSPNYGNSWVKIKIPEGSSEIDDINNTIQHEMEKKRSSRSDLHTFNFNNTCVSWIMYYGFRINLITIYNCYWRYTFTF